MSIKIYDIKPTINNIYKELKLDDINFNYESDRIVDLRDNAQITAQLKEKQRNTTAPKHS